MYSVQTGSNQLCIICSDNGIRARGLYVNSTVIHSADTHLRSLVFSAYVALNFSQLELVSVSRS